MPETLTAFEKYLIRSDRKPGTVKWLLKVMKHIQAHCNPLTPQSFEDYLFDLKQAGRKPSYLNHLIEASHVWGIFCRDEGFGAIKLYKKTAAIREIMTDEEIMQFLAIGCSSGNANTAYSHLTNFWATCAFTGARMGEVAALMAEDVQLGMQTIRINDGKTGARIIPITSVLVHYLTSALANRQQGLLFTNNVGTVLTAVQWGADFHKRLALLGITRKLTPYSLRHSFITDLCSQEDSQLFVIQDIVGHKKADTTRQYFHNNVVKMAKVAQKHTLNQASLTPEQKIALIKEKIREIQQMGGKDIVIQTTQTNNTITLLATLA